MGHAIGDDVIQVTAKRLEKCLGNGDLAARLGGDEFLILTSSSTKELALQKATMILKALAQPIIQNHYTFYTSASIGISIYPDNATKAEELLAYADTAMYKAKELGGNTCQFYQSIMTDIAYETLDMKKDLHEAISCEAFEIYYQPQINSLTDETIGVEALVRWIHPSKGVILPSIFIPLAEKTGLIVVLDLWIIRTAIEQVATWYKEGLTPLMLSINMSMKTLEDARLLEILKSYIDREDFDAKYLEIELTETVLMKNPDIGMNDN